MDRTVIRYTGKPSRARKRRHLGRLKDKIIREVDQAELDVGLRSWYNLWHHHLDWRGLGQEAGRWRRFFADQHYRLFEKYFRQIAKAGFYAQCFLYFNLLDGGQDAPYVHSPNIYHTPPMKWPFDEIGPEDLPQELRPTIGLSLKFYIEKYHIYIQTVEQAQSELSIIKRDGDVKNRAFATYHYPEDADVTVEMYRPVGEAEMELLRQGGFSKWPDRLPDQPIFYPVTNEEYAIEIATKWEARDGRKAYVTRFRVLKSFIDFFDIHTVGSDIHKEWWIPAEDLDSLNANIVGPIEVIATFNDPA